MKWPCCLRLPEGRRPGPGDGASRGIDCTATGGMAGGNVRWGGRVSSGDARPGYVLKQWGGGRVEMFARAGRVRIKVRSNEHSRAE